jgi:hypothetical protein
MIEPTLQVVADGPRSSASPIAAHDFRTEDPPSHPDPAARRVYQLVGERIHDVH